MPDPFWSVTAGRMSGTIQAPTKRSAITTFRKVFPPAEYGSLYSGPEQVRPATALAVARGGYYSSADVRGRTLAGSLEA